MFFNWKQISFSKDGSIPEVESAVIENKLLSQAVLESMIGAHGVSPAAKQSLASRLPELFKEAGDANNWLYHQTEDESLFCNKDQAEILS